VLVEKVPRHFFKLHPNTSSGLKPKQMSLMNFSDLVSGATVRFTVQDGTQYLSIRDLIMVVCEKDANQAGEVWRIMPESRKTEIQDSVLNHKFPGSGQKMQPVITFPGAIKLMMWLPGETAKSFRTKAAEILTRYFAGDKTLLQEIEANAASDAPINQMARAALGDKAKATELEHESLKKIKLENIALNLSNVGTFCNLMGQLRPTWRSDQRLVLQTEDWLKNVAFEAAPNLIQNSDAQGGAASAPAESISISQVARELGMGRLSHADFCKVGKLAAQAYRERYGKNPPTHKQWVDGAERDVKSYTVADRDLIEDALKSYH